jgi:ABC-type polysaccharide/polyol phosphate export permease
VATEALELREYSPDRKRIRISEIWTTWRVTSMVALRDMRVKYKQAALGPLWLLLAPLGLLAAITIAFSGVTDIQTPGVPYVLFALVGLTCWTYIQLCLSLSPIVLLSNSSLVRRSTCPRLALVQGSMIANLPPIGVMLTASLVAVALGPGIPIQALLLPLLAAWLFTLAWGISLLLGAVAARARDIVSVVPLVVQAGLFVTPVGYPIDGAPANIQVLLTINPVSGVIEGWRWALLDMPPNMTAVVISLVFTVVVALVGWRVFVKADGRIADYV